MYLLGLYSLFSSLSIFLYLNSAKKIWVFSQSLAFLNKRNVNDFFFVNININLLNNYTCNGQGFRDTMTNAQ